MALFAARQLLRHRTTLSERTASSSSSTTSSKKAVGELQQPAGAARALAHGVAGEATVAAAAATPAPALTARLLHAPPCQAATLGDPRRPAEIRKYKRPQASREDALSPLALCAMLLGMGAMMLRVRPAAAAACVRACMAGRCRQHARRHGRYRQRACAACAQLAAAAPPCAHRPPLLLAAQAAGVVCHLCVAGCLYQCRARGGLQADRDVILVSAAAAGSVALSSRFCCALLHAACALFAACAAQQSMRRRRPRRA